MKPTVSDSSTLRRLGSSTALQLGIEGGKHARGLQHVAAGDAVEERALAGVGVADQGDRGHGHGLAALALLAAHAAHALPGQA